MVQLMLRQNNSFISKRPSGRFFVGWDLCGRCGEDRAGGIILCGLSFRPERPLVRDMRLL